MSENEHLERHLELCKGIYERLKREGRWPWTDSTESEDVVESDDTNSRA